MGRSPEPGEVSAASVLCEANSSLALASSLATMKFSWIDPLPLGIPDHWIDPLPLGIPDHWIDPLPLRIPDH